MEGKNENIEKKENVENKENIVKKDEKHSENVKKEDVGDLSNSSGKPLVARQLFPLVGEVNPAPKPATTSAQPTSASLSNVAPTSAASSSTGLRLSSGLEKTNAKKAKKRMVQSKVVIPKNPWVREATYHGRIDDANLEELTGFTCLNQFWSLVRRRSRYSVMIAHERLDNGNVDHIHVVIHVLYNNKKKFWFGKELKHLSSSFNVESPAFFHWMASVIEIDRLKLGLFFDNIYRHVAYRARLNNALDRITVNEKIQFHIKIYEGIHIETEMRVFRDCHATVLLCAINRRSQDSPPQTEPASTIGVNPAMEAIAARMANLDIDAVLQNIAERPSVADILEQYAVVEKICIEKNITSVDDFHARTESERAPILFAWIKSQPNLVSEVLFRIEARKKRQNYTATYRDHLEEHFSVDLTAIDQSDLGMDGLRDMALFIKNLLNKNGINHRVRN